MHIGVTFIIWIIQFISITLCTGTTAIKVNHGGLQDFSDEQELENQLKREEFVRNKEHITEHLKSSIAFDPDTASPEELDFHFFKIHDSNNDNKLDGLELLSAIAHGLEEQYEKLENAVVIDKAVNTRKINALNRRSWGAVDMILKDDDKDKDGYLTYWEYKQSRRASATLKNGQ